MSPIVQLKQPCASWDRAHVIQPAESGRAGQGVPAPQKNGHPGLTSGSMRRRKELQGWEYLSYPIMNMHRYQGSIFGNGGGVPEGGYFFPLKFTQAAREPLDGLECLSKVTDVLVLLLFSPWGVKTVCLHHSQQSHTLPGSSFGGLAPDLGKGRWTYMHDSAPRAKDSTAYEKQYCFPSWLSKS